MGQSQLTKPEEIVARSFVDQLILEQLTSLQEVIKISEVADRLQSMNVGLSTIRSLLASNSSKFAYHERRWIPAARLESERRPIHAAISLFVDRFGGPMPVSLLASEISLLGHSTTTQAESLIRKVAASDSLFVLTKKDEVILSKWTFVAHDEPLEQALEVNQVSQKDFDDLSSKLKSIDWRQSDAIDKAVKASAPVDAKVLAAVAWSVLNPQGPTQILLYDWRNFATKLFALDSYMYSSDGKIYSKTESSKWIALTAKLADKIVPTIEIEDVAPVELRTEDIEAMVAKITSSDQSVTATKLLEEIFEVTPVVKTFPDDLANIINALCNDARVWWVGGDRFKKPNTAPDFVHSVPEPLVYRLNDLKDEEGELIDFELNDDGLSSSLRKLLIHPLAMDVMDETLMPASKSIPDQIRLVLKPAHRELGTFPLCQFPTGWLDNAPEIQEIVLNDGKGRQLQAWVNMKDRLIFNLIDWWYEQPIESGAVFTLTKTIQKNVFEFQWLPQSDPVVHITVQRMEQLRVVQNESEGKSTYELLKEVLGHWPKGADFLTILWEMNVVRRSSRRLIGSLLSSYHCFYQRSGSPVWHYDAKKVELGVDKTKKKFILK